MIKVMLIPSVAYGCHIKVAQLSGLSNKTHCLTFLEHRYLKSECDKVNFF